MTTNSNSLKNRFESIINTTNDRINHMKSFGSSRGVEIDDLRDLKESYTDQYYALLRNRFSHSKLVVRREQILQQQKIELRGIDSLIEKIVVKKAMFDRTERTIEGVI